MSISFISLAILATLVIFFVVGAIQSRKRYQKLETGSIQAKHYLQKISFANYTIGRSEGYATQLMTVTGAGLVFGLVELMWQDGIIFYFAAIALAFGLSANYLLVHKIRQRR